MRIKKIYKGTLSEGKILNVYSDSVEDSYTCDYINKGLNTKVAKDGNKVLSTNDFTNAYKTKLDGISEGATKILIDSSLNGTSTNPVQNKIIYTALSNKADVDHTHNYAGSSTPGGAATTSLSCTGNSATCTKATQDSAGQQINTTYIKGLSISGKVITYTKGDNTTGTITTQDTNTTYEKATSASDGLMAKEDKVKMDSFSGVTTITKSLKLTTEWMDTGIARNCLNNRFLYSSGVWYDKYGKSRFL